MKRRKNDRAEDHMANGARLTSLLSTLTAKEKKQQKAFQERVRQWEDSLRELINRNGQLRKHFEYLLRELGWHEDVLVKRLVWDAGRYSHDRSATRPLFDKNSDTLRNNPHFWMKLPVRVRKISDDVEKVNAGPLSPLVARFFHGLYGDLNRSERRQIYSDFVNLPDILRLWADSVSRNAAVARNLTRQNRNSYKEALTHAEHNFLEVEIYASSHQFHKDRLYMLFEAALSVVGEKIISPRAFTLRLNKLKKELSK